jgi:hypothetical protein
MSCGQVRIETSGKGVLVLPLLMQNCHEWWRGVAVEFPGRIFAMWRD